MPTIADENATVVPPSGHPRPLVMRCGALGDMTMLTPLIRALAARFGQPVDIVSSGPWTASLLEGQPGVGDLFLVRSRRRPYFVSPDQWRLVRQLRNRGAGPTWFMDLHGIGMQLLTRAGIGPEWIIDAETVPLRSGEHGLDRFLRLAAINPPALATPPPAPAIPAIAATLLVTSNSARREVADWLARLRVGGRPFLVVQAGNKRTMRRGRRRRPSNQKYWPESRWVGVISAMRDRCPDHAILLLGVASESALNEDILRLAACRDVFNVAADRSVAFLIALLEMADGMVSVDTGPAHVAAAVGLPLVVMFRGADAIRYVPRGVPGGPVICVRADPPGTLEGVTEESVVSAWRKLSLRSEGARPLT